MTEIQLDQIFIEDFKKWLHLKWEGVTWFGKFQKEFDLFWSLIYSHPLDAKSIYRRHSDLLNHIGLGPVHSWLAWLSNRFLCYLYIQKNISIEDLSTAVGSSFQNVSLVLRDFFVEALPYLEDEFGDIFLNGNILSPNLQMTYQEIQQEFNLEKKSIASGEDEVMNALEVTLYPEWQIVLNRLQNLQHRNVSFTLPDTKEFIPYIKIPWRFTRDLVLLILCGMICLQGIKYFNQYYERSMVDKISIFEPDFLWLNKKLAFKDTTNQPFEVQVSPKEFEDLEKSENLPWEENSIEEVRYGTESDATVTTWSDLPRDLEQNSHQLSPYEESDRDNLRDTAFGSRRIFRVMLRSIMPEQNLAKINQLMTQFGAQQVDKVSPGQMVPGGYYYNLYIPLGHLRDFLGQVSYVDDSIMFESKTRGDNPPGMGRVFIWIKKI